MKQFLLTSRSLVITTVLLLCVGLSQRSYGQTATWNLTSSFTPATCGTIATSGPAASGLTNVTGSPNATSGFSTTGWPTSTTFNQGTSGYIQYQFTNNTGATISVNTLNLTVYASSNNGGNTRGRLYYSTSASFAGSIEVSGASFALNNATTTTFNNAVTISLTNGTTLYLRFYAYGVASSTTTTVGNTSLFVNAATINNPTGFTATAASSAQINLAATADGAGDNVILAWNTTNTFGTPTPGTPYTSGNTIAGGGTVLYVGAAGNPFYNHTGLTAGTQYFYKLWSVSGCNLYSTGTTANATTLIAPTLTAAAGATVDNSFNVTFTDNATWRGAITSITVNGNTLSPTAYTISAGKITFNPANSTLLQAPGSLSIVVFATNYNNDAVTQTLSAGAATSLNMTTISSPQTTGVNFSVTITGTDKYGNPAAGTLTMTTTAGTITPGTATLTNGTTGATNFSVSTAGLARTITATAVGGAFVTSNTFDVYTSAATDYFRSQASGNWGTAATWQTSHDSSTWFTSSLVPGNSAKRITIQGTNNVTVAASTGASNIIINSTATLTVNNTRTFTLGAGSDTALYVFGTLANNGTVSLSSGAFLAIENGGNINNVATMTVNAGSSVFVNGGGTYFHNQSGGTIPTAHWDINSTCNVNGATFGAPNGLGQSFGNFTWSSGNFFAFGIAGTLTTINGDFTYAATSNNALELNTATATTPTINIGGDFNMQSGTLNFDDGTAGVVTFNVGGKINITGGTFTPDQGTSTTAHNISVAGNWTLNTGATFNQGSTTVIFNGSSPQTLGGTKSTTFNNLTMNGSGGLTLGRAATVTGVLTFTNGIISTTATNLLTINAGGSAINASNSSFVDGPIAKTGNTAFTFPVGVTGTGYVPIAIASLSGSYTYVAQYNRTNAAAMGGITAVGLDHVTVCDNWTLAPTSLVGGPTANVTGFWNTNSPCNGENLSYYITDVNSIVLAHFNGTSWNAFGNNTITGDNVTGGSVTWNTVSSFSPFALGSTTPSNPLPVTLVNFRAVLNNGAVDLTWTTEQETNSDHFDIQRSADGSNWSSIGTVAAQGNSATPTNYSYIDNSPSNGVNYYRLKMVDKGGAFSYSSIQIVSLNSVAAFKVFPNPAKDFVNVTFGHVSDNGVVRIININGQSVFTQAISNASGSTISIPVHNLAEGTYMVQVLGSDGSQQTGKIVIVH